MESELDAVYWEEWRTNPDDFSPIANCLRGNIETVWVQFDLIVLRKKLTRTRSCPRLVAQIPRPPVRAGCPRALGPDHQGPHLDASIPC